MVLDFEHQNARHVETHACRVDEVDGQFRDTGQTACTYFWRGNSGRVLSIMGWRTHNPIGNLAEVTCSHCLQAMQERAK